MQTLTKLFAITLLSTATLCLAEDKNTAAQVPAPNANTAVGLSSRDGISLSGTDVLVTKNGVSETLTKDLTLDSGVKIMRDGTVVGTDGSKIMLRPGQIVTFDGKLVSAPVVEAVPAGATSIPNRTGASGAATGTSTATGNGAVTGSGPTTPAAQQ